MNKIKRITTKVLAVTEKELRIRFRFKVHHLNKILIFPFLSIMPYLLIFFGFFMVNTNSVDTSSITELNFITWILLGILLTTFFKNGYTLYDERFKTEKYWGTIESTFMSPTNDFIFLIGFAFALFLELIPFFLLIFILSSIFYPTLLINLFFIIIFLAITIIGISGLGIIRGTLVLANEDFTPFFVYIEYILLFFSTNTIPLEFYPNFLQFIVLINPLYHGFELLRDLWFLNPINYFSLLYYLIFQIIILTFGILFYKRIWRKYGIQG